MTEPRISFFVLVFLIAAAVSPSAGQSESNVLSDEAAIKNDMDLAVCDNKKRAEAVRRLFVSKGAAKEEIYEQNSKHFKNVYVEIPGREDEVIVVGAHFDKADVGCGAIDNWSGVVIVANIYASLKKLETTKTLRFVAFGAEEQGLKGSGLFVRSLSKTERKQHCAMVNFDSFGLAYPQILLNTADRGLVRLFEKTGTDFGLKVAKARIRGARSDAESFDRKGIPSIDIHGLSNDFQNFLHSKNDQLSNVNHTSVYIGYRLGLAYVFSLDGLGCREYSVKDDK